MTRPQIAIAATAAFVLATIISGLLGSKALLFESAGTTSTQDIADLPDSTSFRIENQLVLVYVGRASCRFCTSREMHRALDSVRSLLGSHALKEQVSFRVHAIGVDADAKVSLRHLEKMGPFDAVSAGDRWLSISAGQVAWGSMAGPRATPQLIVIARSMRVSGTPSAGFVEVLNERVVARKIGLFEIEEWVSQGTPIGVVTEGAEASKLLSSLRVWR